MNNYIMNIIGTTTRTNRFDAEGAWGGAKWDGVLNVGMYLFKKRVESQRNPIFVISEYNPQWKEIAKKEMDYIKESLSKFPWFKDIQHIGSTSIEGMGAKPFIDLMLGVTEESNREDIGAQLALMGWFHHEHQFFDKVIENTCLTIHLCSFDSSYWKCRIIFRDHFLKNPEEIKDYTNLKKQLISMGISFDEYVIGKQRYIYNILLREGLTHEEMRLGLVFYIDPFSTKTILPKNIYFHFRENIYG